MKSRFGVILGSAWGFLAQAFPAGAGKQLPAGYSQLLLGPQESLEVPKNASLGFDLLLKPYRSIQLGRVLRVAKQNARRGRLEVLGGQVGLLIGSLFAQAGLWAGAKYFSAPLVSYSFSSTQDLNLMFCKASHASFVFTDQRGCDGVFQDHATFPPHPHCLGNHLQEQMASRSSNTKRFVAWYLCCWEKAKN